MQTTPATVASGQTPISIDWDYNNFAYIKGFPSAKWGFTIPSDGVYGGYYSQAVNATAPHPWAARLWQEFLYSDQGQIIWLKGCGAPGAVQRPRRPQGHPGGADQGAPGGRDLLQGQVREHRPADEGQGADRAAVADGGGGLASQRT